MFNAAKSRRSSNKEKLTETRMTEYRKDLVSKINITTNELTLGLLIKKMVEDKGKWSAAYNFAEKVFLEKEEKKRQFEMEANSLSPEESQVR